MFVKSAIMAGNDSTSCNASCPEKPEMAVENGGFSLQNYFFPKTTEKQFGFDLILNQCYQLVISKAQKPFNK